MPVAAIVPAALGVASLVAGNVANKSANANNLNQQGGAIQNSKKAYANAENQMNTLLKNNPSPYASQTIAQPTPGAQQAPSIASQILPAQGQQQPMQQPSAAQQKPAAPSPTMPGQGKIAQPIARNPGTMAGIDTSNPAVSPTSLARLIMMSSAA